MGRRRSVKGAVAVAATAMVVVGSLAAPAQAATYDVTSTSLCGGAGTFEQALKDANANPGTDIITFTPGLVVDAGNCTEAAPRPFPFATFATDSVTIVGNGATIEGSQYYLNMVGHVNTLSHCPDSDPNIRQIAKTYGFMQIGTFDADNSAISVSMSDLKFHNMPTLAKVEQNASITMTDSSASDIVDFNQACNRPAIEGAHGANVSLVRTLFVDSTMIQSNRAENSLTAMVRGDGNLVLDHAKFGNNLFGRAVTWLGGTAKIDSSVFLNSGGLVLNADSTVMVNSALYEDSNFGTVPGGQGGSNRVVQGRGTSLFRASSFYWVDPTCANCTDKGMGLWIADAAAHMNLRSTAIGSGATADSGPMLIGFNGNGLPNNFGADAMTWLQPTENQDAATLALVVPAALSDPPGLTTSATSSTPYVSALTPLLGTPPTPGVLLDAVTGADCGGANQLLSPIDGSCVTTDVLGNPRIDQGNASRDIGAVQTAQSAHLVLTSVSETVGLGWNWPPDPESGPITGYRVTSVPVAGGTALSVDVTGGQSSSTTISGLTMGVLYRFVVRPLNAVGAGEPSNEVEATPLGDVAPPVPTATHGDTTAQVSWTEPSLGGHPGPPSYFVVYRPTGTGAWTTGPGPLSGRITTLPDLTNGTIYDVGVFATSTDGTASVVGATTVTPSGLPAAPPLTATDDGPANGHVALTWTAPDANGNALTGYQVQCRPTGTATWTDEPTAGLGTSLTATGLAPGTPVECRVAAVNANGPGPWSTPATATPLGPLAAPTVSATHGDTTADLSWTVPDLGGHPGPPAYFVKYRPTGTATWATGPGPLTGSPTTLAGLVNGTRYDVGVYAVSTDGTEGPLGTTAVTPSGLPATPVLTATDDGPANGHLALTWTAPDANGSPLTGYRVQCRPTGSATWTDQPITGLGTSFTISGLQPGTAYECQVAAVNANGAGSWSTPATATPLGPVAAPTVTATPGDTTAHLSWTVPDLGGHAGPPTYQVQFRPTGTTTWTTGPGPLSASTTTIPGLTNGTTYDIAVVATSADGTDSPAGTATVTPTASSGGGGTGTGGSGTAGTSTGHLAQTGFDAALLGLVSLTLIGAGVALVASARRRRSAA